MLDQGPYGTCLAHATTTVHEYKHGKPGHLSPEGLYFHAAGPDWNAGTTTDEINQALAGPGHPVRADCPSTPPNSVPRTARHVTATGQSSRQSVGDLLQVLKTPQPHVLVMNITEQFAHYQPGTTLSYDPNDSIYGQHGIVALGATHGPQEPEILIRNSWGPDWGDQGHAWLGASYVENHLIETLTISKET